METNEKLRNESIASLGVILEHAKLKRDNLRSDIFLFNSKKLNEDANYWYSIVESTNQELEFRIKNIFGD